MENKLFIVRYEIKTRTVKEEARGEVFNSLLDLGMSAVNGSTKTITDFQLVWAKNTVEANNKFEAFIKGQKSETLRQLGVILTITNIQVSEAIA